MRPLFADFAQDKKVWNMTDEFMFGRSILAAPIVDPQYTEEKIIRTNTMTGWDRQNATDDSSAKVIDFTATKNVVKYLPKGTVWYDFWTGTRYKGGQDVNLLTSLETVPMFARAGSIVPLGPEMQYVGEKSWDNLEIRVYPGADGSFTLYEDEGDSYNYEKGVYATIDFKWNDRRNALTISEQKGNYPGMLTQRRFTIVLPDGQQSTIEYNGKQSEVTFKPLHYKK